MAGNRNILDSPQQSLYGQPQVAFRPQDFNAVIWSHVVNCFQISNFDIPETVEVAELRQDEAL